MIKKNSRQYIEDKKRKGLYGWDDPLPLHPGQTLKDEMAFWGFTQAKLAAKVGCTVQTINRIVKARESISPEIAIKLERAFNGRPSAKLWLSMQTEYDRVMAREKEEKQAEEEVGFFEARFLKTFKELQKLGLGEGISIRTKEGKRKAVLFLKNFFETSYLDSIQDKNILGVAFRKYDRKNLNQYNLAALLKIGEKEAKKQLDDTELPEYDENGFELKLNDIKRLTKLKPKEFRKKLQEECLKFGVIVVYVPNITNTFFGGATTWIGYRPIIMLKLENQWEDIFWFNFFHESAHILKHNKKEIFIDFEDGHKTETEKEADRFAQKNLVPFIDEVAEEIEEKKGTAETLIKKAAQKAGVSESIVAGQICNYLGEGWKEFGKLRSTIKEKVDVQL